MPDIETLEGTIVGYTNPNDTESPGVLCIIFSHDSALYLRWPGGYTQTLNSNYLEKNQGRRGFYLDGENTLKCGDLAYMVGSAILLGQSSLVLDRLEIMARNAPKSHTRDCMRAYLRNVRSGMNK